MGLSIRYSLTGRGWSRCEVEIDDQAIFVTASYLSDALGDLLQAIKALLSGAGDATATFEEEPGQYRWRLTLVSPGQLSVRILWPEHEFSRRPDEEGRVVFNAPCRFRTFAGAVLSAAQQVRVEHGLEGYRREWGHPYPLELESEIKQLLALSRPTVA
jgi:hypothetical protein